MKVVFCGIVLISCWFRSRNSVVVSGMVKGMMDCKSGLLCMCV